MLVHVLLFFVAQLMLQIVIAYSVLLNCFSVAFLLFIPCASGLLAVFFLLSIGLFFAESSFAF